MNDSIFIKNYLEIYYKTLFQKEIIDKMIQMKNLLLKTNKNGHKVIFVGNGGSAATASHCSVDFTKQAGIKSINFNESDLITAFSNDYGYEYWIHNALKFYSNPSDVIVFISSSGKSANVVNAAKFAKKRGNTIITFTGLNRNNPLKSLGDINFWVDSKGYNIIECTHQIWLLTVCDLIIGKVEYSVS